MVAAAGGAAGDGACWGGGGGCLLQGLLALGPVEDGRLIALRTNHGTAGVCRPRGRWGQGGARRPGGGLRSNATAPARDPATETASAGQAGTGPRRRPPRPRAFRTPLSAPRPLLPAASRAPNPSAAQNPAPQLGAAADVSPGGARGRDAGTRVWRPGARGLAEPPCDGGRPLPAPAGRAGTA